MILKYRKNGAVTNIIGFILVFSLTVAILTSVMISFYYIADVKKQDVYRQIANDIADRISYALSEAISSIELLENSNYSTTVDLPTTGDVNFCIEISKGVVYVNSTDGKIRVSREIPGKDKNIIRMEGKIYTGGEKLKVYATKSTPYLSIDFGTPSSEIEEGCIVITNQTNKTKTDWPTYKGMVTFMYRASIEIDNSDFRYNESTTIPSQNLSNFTLPVYIPQSFPYQLIETDGKGYPKILFWEPSTPTDTTVDDNEIRPYYIEAWRGNPPGTSVVWVNISSIKNNSKKIIYMLFNPIDKTSLSPVDISDYGRCGPDKIFAYFEDFDIANQNSTHFLSPVYSNFSKNFSFYKIFYSDEGNLSFVRLPYPSFLACGKLRDVLIESPSYPSNGENSTFYILEAKVRLNGEKPKGEIVTHFEGKGRDTVAIGGFVDSTTISTPSGDEKISSVDGKEILCLKMKKDVLQSVYANATASVKSFNIGSGERLLQINASYVDISEEGVHVRLYNLVCSEFQPLCRLNVTTRSWEWIPAGKLKVGDMVCCRFIYRDKDKLVWARIAKIAESYTSISPLSHIASPYGNFFANNFLVHSYANFSKISNSNDLSQPGYAVSIDNSSFPKFSTYKCNISNSELLCDRSKYLYQIRYEVEGGKWYIVRILIKNSVVKGSSGFWTYTSLRSKLYSDGIPVLYTPIEVDTSNPFLEGNIGIGIGYRECLEDKMKGGNYLDVDWIRLRKASPVQPCTTVKAIEAYLMGWNTTQGIRSIDRSKSDALIRDFNIASENRTFCMYIEGGNYTIILHMGDMNDTGKNYSTTVSWEISGCDEHGKERSIVISSSNKTDHIIFTISVPSGYHYLNITFSNEASSPTTEGWIINAIDIEKGYRSVWLKRCS